MISSADFACSERISSASCSVAKPSGGILGRAASRDCTNLCAGYREFFRHIRKYLRAMTNLLEHGYPATLVIEAIKGPLLTREGEPVTFRRGGKEVQS